MIISRQRWRRQEAHGVAACPGRGAGVAAARARRRGRPGPDGRRGVHHRPARPAPVPDRRGDRADRLDVAPQAGRLRGLRRRGDGRRGHGAGRRGRRAGVGPGRPRRRLPPAPAAAARGARRRVVRGHHRAGAGRADAARRARHRRGPAPGAGRWPARPGFRGTETGQPGGGAGRRGGRVRRHRARPFGSGAAGGRRSRGAGPGVAVRAGPWLAGRGPAARHRARRRRAVLAVRHHRSARAPAGRLVPGCGR